MHACLPHLICKFTHVCIHTYIHTNIDTYMYTYIHTHQPTYKHANMHPCIHGMLCVRMDVCILFVKICMFTYVYVCTYIFTHICVLCTYGCVFKHPYLHTYMYTSIRKQIHNIQVDVCTYHLIIHVIDVYNSRVIMDT